MLKGVAPCRELFTVAWYTDKVIAYASLWPAIDFYHGYFACLVWMCVLYMNNYAHRYTEFYCKIYMFSNADSLAVYWGALKFYRWYDVIVVKLL